MRYASDTFYPHVLPLPLLWSSETTQRHWVLLAGLEAAWGFGHPVQRMIEATHYETWIPACRQLLDLVDDDGYDPGLATSNMGYWMRQARQQTIRHAYEVGSRLRGPDQTVMTPSFLVGADDDYHDAVSREMGMRMGPFYAIADRVVDAVHAESGCGLTAKLERLPNYWQVKITSITQGWAGDVEPCSWICEDDHSFEPGSVILRTRRDNIRPKGQPERHGIPIRPNAITDIPTLVISDMPATWP